MIDINALNSLYEKLNREKMSAVSKATADSGELPPGAAYVGKIVSIDLGECNDDDGETYPMIVPQFEITVSGDNPKFVGRQLKEFLRWSPSFDDGSSSGMKTTAFMYKKAFDEPFPFSDGSEEGDAAEKAALLRFCTDLIGTSWKINRKQNKAKTYTNTNIGNIVQAD